MKDYILLLPIIFIFHDMEEIIGFGRFFKNNPDLFERFPLRIVVWNFPFARRASFGSHRPRALHKKIHSLRRHKRALPSHKRRDHFQVRQAHYVQRRDHSLHSFSLCPYDCKLKVRAFSYALVQQKIILRRPRFSASIAL